MPISNYKKRSVLCSGERSVGALLSRKVRALLRNVENRLNKNRIPKHTFEHIHRRALSNRFRRLGEPSKVQANRSNHCLSSVDIWDPFSAAIKTV